MKVDEMEMDQVLAQARDPQRHAAKFVKTERYGERFCCPCCRMPTLEEAWVFESCSLCWWEDDPDGIARPDQAGPCNRVSLNRAKSNFLRLGTCFEPADNPYLAELLDSEVRRELTAYASSVRFGNAELDMKLFIQKLDLANRDYHRRLYVKERMK